MRMIFIISTEKGKLPVGVYTDTYRFTAPQEAREHRNRDESFFLVAGFVRHVTCLV